MPRERHRVSVARREGAGVAYEAHKELRVGARIAVADGADRRVRPASSNHDVQISRCSAQEIAVGRGIAGKGVHLYIAAAHGDGRMSGSRETHAIALEHRKPAIDA